jgi:hypothetical protein
MTHPVFFDQNGRRPPDGWGRLLPAEPNSLFRIIPVAMTDADADSFRKEAEECSKQAERSVSQLDKDYWLRLAADWIKLAENAVERRSKFWPR